NTPRSLDTSRIEPPQEADQPLLLWLSRQNSHSSSVPGCQTARYLSDPAAACAVAGRGTASHEEASAGSSWCTSWTGTVGWPSCTVYRGTLSEVVLIHGPLPARSSRAISASKNSTSSAELGSSGSSAESGSFQKL